jgi:hypothetical protein
MTKIINITDIAVRQEKIGFGGSGFPGSMIVCPYCGTPSLTFEMPAYHTPYMDFKKEEGCEHLYPASEYECPLGTRNEWISIGLFCDNCDSGVGELIIAAHKGSIFVGFEPFKYEE